MNLQNVFTVYAKELRDTLRDRRTLMSMIVVPTLIMPTLILGFGALTYKVVNQARKETPTIMVIGADHSPEIRAALEKAAQFKLVAPTADYRRQITEKKVRAAVEIPPDFDAALDKSELRTVKIYTYNGELRSGFAEAELDDFLRTYREQVVQRKLTEKNLPTAFARPFDITRENVAPPEKVGGNAIGGVVPYLLIVLCFVGAMYPAMDLTAGEKERGTMETILCSPVARIELVLGKFLTVLTASLATVTFSIASFGVSALVGGALLASSGIKFSHTALPAAGNAAGMHTSVATAASELPTVNLIGVLGVFGLVIPLAILFSALLFTVSLFAKSYKEAQTYATPLILVAILPAIAALLPGVELTSKLALVPVLNVALVSKEMVSGNFPIAQIALIFLSSCVYAAGALALAVRMFEREDVIFRA